MSKPSLHLICGLPGAGKTTLARSLEEETGALRLSPDEWIAPNLSRPYLRADMDRLRPDMERLQWAPACRHLALGASVIWEQGFWQAGERLHFREAAQGLGARVVLHVLDLPLPVLKERLVVRNKALPPGTFHVDPQELETFTTWFERPTKTELAGFDGVCLYEKKP